MLLLLFVAVICCCFVVAVLLLLLCFRPCYLKVHLKFFSKLIRSWVIHTCIILYDTVVETHRAHKFSKNVFPCKPSSFSYKLSRRGPPRRVAPKGQMYFPWSLFFLFELTIALSLFRSRCRLCNMT